MKNNNTKLLKSVSDYYAWRETIQGSVGFVPTLGGLHGGHISLIKKSLSICDHTVLSIFLNPLQFSKNEDLDTYPSNIVDDLKKINKINISIIFIPEHNEILSSNSSVFIVENYLSNCIEGQRRPDFFSGVLTIVTKLFNIISPTHAFFGEKDPQQLLLIKKLCVDLNFNIKIIPCPTIREKNGLAISSRNCYLTRDEKKDASVIYQSLTAAQLLLKNGIISVVVIRNKMKKILLSCPSLKIDYLSFSDINTLKELKNLVNQNLLISVAVFIGKTRLIDSLFYSTFNDG